jgi:hypothetical protein
MCFPQVLAYMTHRVFQRYLTLKPLSPDLVEISECSTPVTRAAEGPSLMCSRNCLIASLLP